MDSFKGLMLGGLAVALLAAAVSAVVCRFYLEFARAHRLGQKVREDGPQSHLKKAGTPSMGGVAFIVVVAVASLGMAAAAWSKADRMMVGGLVVAAVGMGLIGLWDDLAKVVGGRTRGVLARWRILLEIAVACAAVAFLDAAAARGHVGAFRFPIGLDGLSGPMAFAVRVAAIVGCANAVNFTDGVDGLAGSTVAIASMGLMTLAAAVGLAPAVLTAACVGGAAAGFLLYNRHPAKLFMGDVGSMTLGGGLGGIAVALRAELLLILLGGVFVVETLSVIAQVVSFQLTRRRVLRMAPLHHHLELCGWPENRIVAAASAVQVVLVVVSVALGLGAVRGV